MYVTDAQIDRMIEHYGRPATHTFTIPITAREFLRIRNSQKRGRNHDVTLYVHKGDQWIVIAKNVYPPGLYRSPSGGLEPGEDFAQGIDREVREELGCRITLERFLLVTRVVFTFDPRKLDATLYDFSSSPADAQWEDQVSLQLENHSLQPGETLTWRSFVFVARYDNGDFDFSDKDEIREVKLVPWEAFAEFGEIMRARGTGGLYYRALLHDEVAKLLGKA